MKSAQEALGLILESVRLLPTETVELSKSLNRHLADSIIAPIDLPPFDNSAMDGFAIRSTDTKTASEARPVRLKVLRTIAAGDREDHCRLPLQSNQAIRIMTGAPLPDGADAVIPFEETVEGAISQPVDLGENVRRAGEDVAKDTRLFEVGERINARTIALLAALGIDRVSVFRKPRVQLLSTGSELVDVGAGSSRPGAGTAPLQPGQIYNSNGPALTAALKEMGIETELIGVAVDTEEALKNALSRPGAKTAPLQDVDVLITIGGVSAGDFDLVPKALKTLGAKIVFHKVAIKPGKPFLYAIHVGAGSPRPGAATAPLHIFALPGNPVSALMVFDRFVRPALLKMMGAGKIGRTVYEAVAAVPFKGAFGREVYLRGLVTSENGRFVARSAGAQGSAMLYSFARANAVLIVPASQLDIAVGESLSFEFLDEVL